jgi:hypothetical protein
MTVDLDARSCNLTFDISDIKQEDKNCGVGANITMIDQTFSSEVTQDLVEMDVTKAEGGDQTLCSSIPTEVKDGAVDRGSDEVRADSKVQMSSLHHGYISYTAAEDSLSNSLTPVFVIAPEPDVYIHSNQCYVDVCDKSPTLEPTADTDVECKVVETKVHMSSAQCFSVDEVDEDI